ncbi:LOW QUALITY PROTEIN: bolA-like protein 2 [Anser cygnoides]|uniref:LOW QUALITY PROTEIN: bolA-like protein 2 n=1 Tax=Anser cygnoides TaxID=8845 RepID=UPI0034D382ED
MAEPELSAEALRERLRRELGAEHVVGGGGDRGGLPPLSPRLPPQGWRTRPAARCAASFRVLVVAAAFRGKGLLQRHRLVNEALAAELGRIHALEQRTLTPEQWAAEGGSERSPSPTACVTWPPPPPRNTPKRRPSLRPPLP